MCSQFTGKISEGRRQVSLCSDPLSPSAAAGGQLNTIASAMQAMQTNGGVVSSPAGRGGIAMSGTAHSPLNFAEDGMDF